LGEGEGVGRAEDAALNQARGIAAERERDVERVEHTLLAGAKRAASRRERLAHAAVGQAERMARQSARARARGISRNAKWGSQRLSHPYANTNIHDEVKLLKSMASGAALTQQELHVLGAMSIGHHETTLRQ